MKTKTWIIIGVIVALIFILYSMTIGKYNTMVTMEEEVTTEWAQVETQYQRRADLIPNLVNVVKGYAEHEKEVFTEVAEARSRAGQIKISVDDLDDENIQKYMAAQQQVGSALSRLLAVAENYPQLKANQNFLDLQVQLEGTENRISVARNRYNEVVKYYNTYIRQFPNNIISGIYGFERKQLFESQEGSEVAPKVEF